MHGNFLLPAFYKKRLLQSKLLWILIVPNNCYAAVFFYDIFLITQNNFKLSDFPFKHDFRGSGHIYQILASVPENFNFSA